MVAFIHRHLIAINTTTTTTTTTIIPRHPAMGVREGLDLLAQDFDDDGRVGGPPPRPGRTVAAEPPRRWPLFRPAGARERRSDLCGRERLLLPRGRGRRQPQRAPPPWPLDRPRARGGRVP